MPVRRHPPQLHLTAACARALLSTFAALPVALPAVLFGTAAHAQAQPASFAFDIPAGPLSTTLTRIAAQTGAELSANAEQTTGKTAPPVRGRLTLEQALTAALAGSGLEAVSTGRGFGLSRVTPTAPGKPATDDTTLPAVKVSARRERGSIQDEGSAADGYRTQSVSAVGALGGMALLDTPFSISVVPQALMQNIQAQSPDDVYKLNPATLSHVPQASGYAPMVKIRGFNTYDRAEDGLRRAYGIATSMEDKERIEVLSGPSGFLFGAASPGGMVNYVNKRPTPERVSSVTLGNYGGSQYFVHGDFGGPIDGEGTVGYRANLVRQNSQTVVDDQQIDRTLASVALDFKIGNRLKLELDASYSDYGMQAPTQYWFFREGVPRVKAPDSSKNWGQPWTREQTISRKWATKAVYEASDHLTLRMAYLRDDQDRPQQDHTLNSVRSPTEYYQLRSHSGPTRTDSEAWQALADLTFDTGSIRHKVTLGYYGYSEKQWQTSYSPNTGYLGPNGFDAPTHVPQPVWPAMPANAMYYLGRVGNDNLVIGDMVRFDDRWSALVGINHSTINSTSLDATGSPTQPDYERSRRSPTLSLIFKPAPWLTTYATYIEGLEQGGVAPTSATNPLAIMPPMQSKQIELGAKAELGGVLVSGALFDIKKAYEYANADNFYGQDGIQRHRGAEVSAVGKLTSAWTVMTGVTALMPKIQGGSNDGKAPLNVPKVVAKLYSEYALPFAPGLSLTGGVYHVGKRWATATNTTRLPSYATVDLGMYYATRMSGRPVSLRITVNNVADRDYWLSSYYLGAPRSVAFSGQVQF